MRDGYVLTGIIHLQANLKKIPIFLKIDILETYQVQVSNYSRNTTGCLPGMC